MRYKVKKGSSLARVLTDEQKELRYEIYPVDLNFSERILEGIKEEVNNFIKK